MPPRSLGVDAHASCGEGVALRGRPRLGRGAGVSAQEAPPDHLAGAALDGARVERDRGAPGLAGDPAASEAVAGCEIVKLLELDGREACTRRLLRDHPRERARDVRGALQERVVAVGGSRASLGPARDRFAEPDGVRGRDAHPWLVRFAAEPGLDSLAHPGGRGVRRRVRVLRILAPGTLPLLRRCVVDRLSPGGAVDPGLLDERVDETPPRAPWNRRHRKGQQLRGAERVARREGEGEAERKNLERGAPARSLARGDGGEGMAHERRPERAEVAPRDERRGVEPSRAGVGGRQLRRLERRVGLEDEDRIRRRRGPDPARRRPRRGARAEAGRGRSSRPRAASRDRDARSSRPSRRGRPRRAGARDRTRRPARRTGS